MTIRQICDVKDNKLVIDLPKSFKNHQKVMVIVDDEIDTRLEKIILMKQAAKDPLYLADMEAVEEDFNFADSEAK